MLFRSLSAELFRLKAGIPLLHVPYKGGGPALNAVVSGETQLSFPSPIPVAPHVKSGRVRALGITSLKRRADSPDLPTLAETVAPGYEAGEWFAVFAPAGLPKPLIERLHGDLAKTINDAELRERLAAGGMDVIGGAPAELAALVKRDYAKWSRLIKETGLKAD